MRRFSSMGLALALLIAPAACASAGGGGVGDAGDRPEENTHTREAGRFLAQAYIAEGEQAESLYRQAREAALSSIAADPDNPKGYLLAGQAQIGLGEYVAADTLLDRAEALYPPYADEIAGEREQGWIAAYNVGVEALNAGNPEAARAAFEAAATLFGQRPEAYYVLGSLYTQAADLERAVEAYRNALRVVRAADVSAVDTATVQQWRQIEEVSTFSAAQALSQLGRNEEAAEVMREYAEAHRDEPTAMATYAEFLNRAGRQAEAERIYEQLLARDDLTAETYYLIGIGFFNAGAFDRATNAFRDAARLNPYDRGTQFNLVQSLYSQAVQLEENGIQPGERAQIEQLYTEMLEAAQNVREADPFNRNLLSFMIRGNRGLSEVRTGSGARQAQQRVRELLQLHEEMPFEVADLSMTRTNGGVQVTGSLQNVHLSGGTPVRLRFTVLSAAGQELGAETVTIPAPPQGQARTFQTMIQVPAGSEPAAWRYSRVD